MQRTALNEDSYDRARHAHSLGQWFSTCGPQKYFVVGHRAFWFEKVVFAQGALYSLTLSESLQKVAVNGELTFGDHSFLTVKSI